MVYIYAYCRVMDFERKTKKCICQRMRPSATFNLMFYPINMYAVELDPSGGDEHISKLYVQRYWDVMLTQKSLT